MVQPEEEKRIILGDADIDWEITEYETNTFISMWQEGKSMEEIVETMKRKPVEIMMLIWEQGDLGEIEQRRQGIF